MASITGTPVWVEGTLSAGNVRAGRVLIDPATDTEPVGSVWSKTIDVSDMEGTGLIHAFVTPHTTVPGGTKTSGGSVQQVSVCNETSTTFEIRMYRTTEVGTWIFWFAIRSAS